MNYERGASLTIKQQQALEWIANNDYYPFWVFQVLQYISPKTIRGFDVINANGRIRVPKKIHSKCPHCNNVTWLDFSYISDAAEIGLVAGNLQCNICEQKSTLILMGGTRDTGFKLSGFQELWISPVPKDDSAEAPIEVDEDLRKDFREAIQCLEHSPRASALLLRYCLQKTLRRKAGITKSSLKNEIDQTINNGSLPDYIIESLHEVRVIGNFGAHPSKDINTGDIIDVEKDEVEELIEIIRQLLDFYYVQPVNTQKRKARINQKLQNAGMKERL